MKKLLLVTFIFILPSILSAQIVVGGKNFTEQYILAEVLKRVLQKELPNVSIRKKVKYNTSTIRPALLNGDVQIYIEYLGTAYTAIHKQNDSEIARDPNKILSELQRLDEPNSLVWLGFSKLNNTYTLVMKQDDASYYDIKNISDLASVLNDRKQLKFGLEESFKKRADGWNALKKRYEFSHSINLIENTSSYNVHSYLNRGQIHVGLFYSTNSHLADPKFVALIDDKKYFPNYSAAIVVRRDTLDKYPAISDISQRITSGLSNEVMVNLNHLVDIKKQKVEYAAQKFIDESY